MEHTWCKIFYFVQCWRTWQLCFVAKARGPSIPFLQCYRHSFSRDSQLYYDNTYYYLSYCKNQLWDPFQTPQTPCSIMTYTSSILQQLLLQRTMCTNVGNNLQVNISNFLSVAVPSFNALTLLEGACLCRSTSLVGIYWYIVPSHHSFVVQ